jgi:hypothetical protein
MRIFISHIHEEAPLAIALKKWLESSFPGRLDVFVSSDREDIPPGSKWLEEIDRALRDSLICIVLCSPASVTRPWISFETGSAWQKQIPVLPVCHSGQDKNKLPAPLSYLQSLDLLSPDFIGDLISSLRKHLAIPEDPPIDRPAMIADIQSALSGLDPLGRGEPSAVPPDVPRRPTVSADPSAAPDLIDPKLVRFIPPLPPTKFRIINLPRPQRPPYFAYPYAPSGKLVLYEIPFFLLPVLDSRGAMQGHLALDLQPSQTNEPSSQHVDARVTEASVVHFLISAGHAWRVHEGVQFLGSRVGFLRFQFSGGHEQRIDLVLGTHLREWAFGNNPNLVTELDLSMAKPAWLSHDSTRRFDLLSIDLNNAPRDLHSIQVVAQFEDDHPQKTISTPAIIVSAITVERYMK